MDDYGNETEYSDDDVFQLTPKGYITSCLMGEVENPLVLGEEIWDGLQAMCMRRIKEDDPDAEYPAIAFDGNGGFVLGVNKD